MPVAQRHSMRRLNAPGTRNPGENLSSDQLHELPTSRTHLGGRARTKSSEARSGTSRVPLVLRRTLLTLLRASSRRRSSRLIARRDSIAQALPATHVVTFGGYQVAAVSCSEIDSRHLPCCVPGTVRTVITFITPASHFSKRR